MNQEKNDTLNKFGKLLIQKVRDSVFEEFLRTRRGEIKSKSAQELSHTLKKYDAEAFEDIKACVLSVIDDSLHSFLWMIEQEETLNLTYKTSLGTISLKELSDGLCGELSSEEGWIECFSHYPPSIK